MKYVICLAIVCISLDPISAQEYKSLPIEFGQFFNTYSIINPASNGATSNVEVQMGQQRHGGAWRNISTSFATLAVRIKPKEANSFHAAGFTLISDKEGEYLKRSKFYLNYGWHTRIAESLSLGAGASAGFYSYIVDGTNANVSGAANAPDASLGFWLYSKSYYLGVSANQILNSKLTPLQETTQLVRHYHFTGGYLFNASHSLTIAPKFLFKYCPHFPIDIDIATTAVIQKIIGIGINYKVDRSLVPMVSIEGMKIGKGALKAMLSYSIPVKTMADIKTYELVLHYNFNKREEKK